MKKTILFILLLAGLAFLIYLKPFTPEFWSPRAKYERTLWFSDFSNEDIAAWKTAPAGARKDSLFLELPVNVQIGETGEDITAWAYHFKLSEGQKLLIELSETPDSNLFADLYFREDNGTYTSEATIRQKAFELPILESGTYLLQMQGLLFDSLNARVKLRTAPIYDVFPVAGKGNRAIQSLWGAPRDGGRRKHEGIDIFAKKGTPLLAVCDGEIYRVKEGGLGGKTVWLHDPLLDQSIYYAHLDEQLVEAGDYVAAGDTIGTVGNTGNARTTPPHLHLGIYVHGAIDPLLFVRRDRDKAKPVTRAAEVNTPLTIEEKPARMYFAPNEISKAKAVLVAGTEVKVIGAADDFLHIKTNTGRSFFYKKE